MLRQQLNYVLGLLIILACTTRVSAEPTADVSITAGPDLPFCQSAKLLAGDGAADDFFGVSVSVSSDLALIGADWDDDNGDKSGSAYVFRWNATAWVQEDKLLPDDGAANDQFGRSVSVSGDVALVGAWADDDNGDQSGSAYVFRWNGSAWIQEQKLLPDDGAASGEFGRSVSVSGDVALLGAAGGGGFAPGAAYVFRWNGTAWVQEQQLLAGDGGGGDQFGFSVSVSGDVVLVGAPGDEPTDSGGFSKGSAYVFRWSGSVWIQEQKLLPADPGTLDLFGMSVSVSGNAALVGKWGDDDNGTDSGSAYVFRWNGSAWAQEQKLLADDGASGDGFGLAVSVYGDMALVGARRDDDNGTNAGSAYLFGWNGNVWGQKPKLLVDDGADEDAFGVSVSLSGNVALVGAFKDDSNGMDSGSARTLSIDVIDCNQNDVFDACDIGTGTSGDCNNSGIPDECEVPQKDEIVSEWVGESGLWDDPPDFIDWCLPEPPNNNPGATFDVSIDAPTSIVVLNTSPTVSTVSLSDDAVLMVNDESGANVRTLAVGAPIENTGIFRATDRERLTLDAPVIDQGGVCGTGGILEATDGVLTLGEENDKSILEINGAVVLGGVAQTIGDNSEIHLIGGAELVDVCIDGMVVPDGQTGRFSGTVDNNDVLTIRGVDFDTRFEPATPGAVLDSSTGTGCVRLTSQDHAQLGDFFTAFTNSPTHRIDGAGIIFGGVANAGMIDANDSSGDLILFPPGAKTNSGVFQASDGGSLRIEDNVTQTATGRFEATTGATVQINADVTGTGGLRAAGGTIQIGGLGVLRFRVSVFIGTCTEIPPPSPGFVSRLEVSGSTLNATTDAPGIPNDLRITGGTVSITAASYVTFAGPVTLCPDTDLDPNAVAVLELIDSTFGAGELEICEGATLAVTNSTITVAGLFTSTMTDETNWSWDGLSALVMTGGQGLPDDDPTGYAKLEVGGQDVGTDPANHVGDPSGFVNNFDLTELVIGPGAHISLVDNADNGNRIDTGFGDREALYVDQLTFADTIGRLNLNGLHLYFGAISPPGAESQVIDCPPGDSECDGDVDLSDFSAVQRCFVQGPMPDECRRFDLNGNGTIELSDFDSFVSALSGPGGS